MHLKKSLVISILPIITSLIIWENYWRIKQEYYKVYLEDSKYLWAQARAKLEKALSNKLILIGSSRSGYNINLHVWKEIQDTKPINLSTNGKSPEPFLKYNILNTTIDSI